MINAVRNVKEKRPKGPKGPKEEVGLKCSVELEMVFLGSLPK
jgi:hypothetical protein